MKIYLLSIALGILSACGGKVETSHDKIDAVQPTPFCFDIAEPATTRAEPSERVSPDEVTASAAEPKKPSSAYWGVAPGEPISLKWEDLLPEAAKEEYYRQQAEFFAALEQKYAENALPLSETESPAQDIEEGSARDVMPQFGTFDVVEEFDGQLIRIPGYVVPLDFGTQQRLAEFLFVPYQGACLHTPPPPPNQIIFVQVDPAVRVKDIWVPYWAEGTLETKENRNEMGDAAYTLKLDKLESYNFE